MNRHYNCALGALTIQVAALAIPAAGQTCVAPYKWDTKMNSSGVCAPSGATTTGSPSRSNGSSCALTCPTCSSAYNHPAHCAANSLPNRTMR